MQKQNASVSEMVHKAHKTIWEERELLAQVNVGDFVEVDYEYMPGTCSDGGIGVITSLINLSDDPTVRTRDKLYATVKYVIDNRVEHSIEMQRLTVVPMPFKSVSATLRKRNVVEVIAPLETSGVKHTPLEWLKLGLSTRKHEKKGWLKQLLIDNNELHPTDEELLWKRVVSDFKCQESYREGMKAVLGSEYKDPREYKGIIGKNSGGKFVSKKKPTQAGVPKNVHSLGYLLYAYNVSKTTFFRRRDAFTNVKLSKVQGKGYNKGLTAIDNRGIASEFYTPRFFYARAKAMSGDVLCNGNGQPLDGWESYARRFGHWGRDWDQQILISHFDQAKYQRMAREHDARQPFIQEELVEALRNNVCTSYRQLAKHVNGWCAMRTIETWLRSHPTYHMYAKNIKPGLTEENRAKQVAFSKRVHNLWGLDRSQHTKILWVMCDEKWFSGLVPRTNAKACAELGIEKESYSAHHKKHLAKVMVHCTVGFCFNGHVENGGDGFLIGAHRCAAFQVPQRDIYFSSKDPVTGRTVFKGNKIEP